MATNKNITMKQYNGTDYDVLYPKTKVSQVDGAVASVNNVTPDNTGAVKVDTFEQSINIQKDEYPTLYFNNAAGNNKAAVICSAGAADHNGGIIIRGWNSDSSDYKELVLNYKNNMAVPIANGGTNATTAAEARTNLGITPATIGALPTTGGVISGDLAVAGSMTLGAISNPTSVLKTLLNPTNFGYITDFNTGNAVIPGLWRVYNDDGSAANAPYSGSVSGVCLVIVVYESDGTMDKAHQLFLDGLGDVYYKVYNNGVSYGTWKKLT